MEEFRLCKKCGKPTPSKTRTCCDDCLSPAVKASMTLEARLSRSKAKLGVKFSDGHRANIAKSRIGKPPAPKTEAGKQRLSERFKGVPLSEEHRHKLSEARMGKQPWNKGIPCSEDVKSRISENLKGRPLSEAAKAKMRGRKLSEEHKHKLSESSAKLIAQGIIGHKSRGKRPTYISKSGVTITFRSSWEYAVALYLDDNEVAWEYELMYLTFDGISYLPDFFIFNANGSLSHIIEVKGWFSEASEKKFVKFWKWLIDQDIALELWDVYELKGRDIL